MLIVGSPSTGIAKNSKVPGGFSSSPHPTPCRCPSDITLRFPTPPHPASVFCGSLNRDGFQEPGSIDLLTSLNYSTVFSKTLMIVF